MFLSSPSPRIKSSILLLLHGSSVMAAAVQLRNFGCAEQLHESAVVWESRLAKSNVENKPGVIDPDPCEPRRNHGESWRVSAARCVQGGRSSTPHWSYRSGISDAVQVHCTVSLLPNCGLFGRTTQSSTCHCTWCLSLGGCHLPRRFLLHLHSGYYTDYRFYLLHCAAVTLQEVMWNYSVRF